MSDGARLVETHISWIILCREFAYKIKRPVKFSFLDFSTLDKRRHYCQRELELNRRTAPEMYLDVVSVSEIEGDRVVDYAVQMKRMDNALELEKMLGEDEVRDLEVAKLGRTVAQFHKKASIVKDDFDTTGLQEQFADIKSVDAIIIKYLGEEAWDAVLKCVDLSHEFLHTHRSIFQKRVMAGFRRDVHGDLRASNIFMYEDPVIFDCIEFNDALRQIDVLNDIAFLCVDLDVHSGLGDQFYESYREAIGFTDDDDSRNLWKYYKSYRANVRAKVTALEMSKAKQDASDTQTLKRYLDLMQMYMQNL